MTLNFLYMIRDMAKSLSHFAGPATKQSEEILTYNTCDSSLSLNEVILSSIHVFLLVDQILRQSISSFGAPSEILKVPQGSAS